MKLDVRNLYQSLAVIYSLASESPFKYMYIRKALNTCIFTVEVQMFWDITLRQPVRGLNKKGKAIPLQDWTGPVGSRRLRAPDFKTIGKLRWYVCQTYAPAAFIPRKYS